MENRLDKAWTGPRLVTSQHLATDSTSGDWLYEIFWTCERYPVEELRPSQPFARRPNVWNFTSDVAVRHPSNGRLPERKEVCLSSDSKLEHHLSLSLTGKHLPISYYGDLLGSNRLLSARIENKQPMRWLTFVSVDTCPFLFYESLFSF